MEDDERFARLKRDPRFLRPKKNSSKVVVDPRFQAIFDGEEFGTSTRDRYGRKVKATTSEDMRRFYRVDEKEDEKEEDGEEGEGDDEGAEEEEEDFGVSEGDEDEEEMEGSRLIRGEMFVESSDEEEEADVEVEEENDDVGIELKEEEKVERGPPSCRFAVVNLDWDNLKASDLWKAFEGFKPKKGQILSISIIPSDFGKERLEKEEREGPPAEIFKNDDDVNKPLFYDQDQDDFDEQALRKYQLERLKYYYAVVECDTTATASAIVEGCDGAEFEKSANYFDLRYIPDDMEFENKPRETITEPPSSYIPADFTTNALQHSRVKLTWDEDDPERIRVTRKKFSKEEIKDMDFKAYLASSSEESEGKEAAPVLGKGKKKEKEDDVHMEITFTPGLSEAVAEKMASKKVRLSRENETVFEAQMRMKRERKKERNAELKRKKKDADSDDEDDFFESDKPKPAKKSKKETAAEQAKSKAELELIMMDDENQTQSRHFDARQILKQEKQLNKKKKKHVKQLEDTQDDFELNTMDPRFAQALTSHQFAIDPTNPNFKKTKNMEKLLAEKRSLNVVDQKKPMDEAPKPVSKRINSRGLWIRCIKRKTLAPQKQGKRANPQ
ncbi:hypothetical protein BC829DRAFT_407503 [Chytridium lagenaria]|nr:hypothetical protein BC829DRAFT_407503 [Chytridium lagenaria]